MELLRGPIRSYPWGSRSVLAALQGRSVPSAGPEAELWLGAHPSDPSTVLGPGGPVSLADVVATDPVRVLGPAAAAEFGPRLPFLLKVLAVEEPLSLQAHPDAAQASQGYAAGSPNYVDPYHKPELLVAVSEFEALCGFRDPDESARALSTLAVPALAPVIAILSGCEPVAGRLRTAVATLLEWPPPARPALFAAVAEAAGRAGAGPFAARLAARYRDDPGVLVALLLNHVTLAPGQAIWLPAGNLHGYLRGVGVEVMAASDNVLRGGLTGKRVDIPELLRVLRFEVLDDPVVPAVPMRPGVVRWPAPVREFALYRVLVDAAATRAELVVPGARIVLCLRGSVQVDDGSTPVALSAGQSAFGRASAHVVTVVGDGELYVATTPPAGTAGATV